jgi:hypothetical protein
MGKVYVRVLSDQDWQRLASQLHDGKCTPFLGAGACHGSLKMAAELSRELAAEHEYPFEDNHDLAKVMRYVTVQNGDPIWVKERFVEKYFNGAESPDSTAPGEPHAALAKFPIPLYLTTNYDDFMVRALSSAGRKPRALRCPWYPTASFSAADFDPPAGSTAVEAPIVYYLHGNSGEPESIVLTEDDYIQFLIALAEERNQEYVTTRVTLIPPAVQEVLSRTSLLFIGYSLRDWNFQVLLHGILKELPPTHKRRHVSVQVLPVDSSANECERRRAMEYLDSYFDDLRVSVYWGTAREFFAELNSRMGSAA